MTPQTFIQKWGPGGPAFHLNEEQGAQSHFLDVCELPVVLALNLERAEAERAGSELT